MVPRRARHLAAVVFLAAAACSNQKTPVPGKPCTFNSDCQSPLVCTFSKCHEACRANGDCNAHERCVYAPLTSGAADAAALRVCIQDTCSLNSACPDPLVCGRDLNCRQECAEMRDCPGHGDQCVIGGPGGEKVCAEPAAVGDDGQLKPAPDAGTAPDAGDAGGAGGAGGASMTTDAADSADAADADAPMDGGAGADVPLDGSQTPDAGAPEVAPMMEKEPNDDQTTATMVPIGVTVVANNDSPTDVDFFEVLAPAGDPSDGYFQASLTHVGTGAIGFSVYSVSDNGIIFTNRGGQVSQSLYFFWAASPGQKYQIRTVRATGNADPSFPYTLDVAYTAIADPHEPNEDSDTPAPIMPNVPVTAYFFKGYTMATLTLDEDWFSIPLNAGLATFTVSPGPMDVLMGLFVYDPNFVQVLTSRAQNFGAGFSATYMVMTPTIYRVRLYANSSVGYTESGSSTLPDSFKRSYTLTVSQ